MRDARSPVGAYVGRDSLTQCISSLVIPAGDDDVRAGTGQFCRDHPAHPSSSPGDERDTAAQVDLDVGGDSRALPCGDGCDSSSTVH